MLTRRRFLGSTALLTGLIVSESAKALVTGEPSRTARAFLVVRSRYAAAHALGRVEPNQRYLSGRADGFQLYGSGRIMNAQV